ncbi:MAG: valine--tRNA ligase [Deltaproteobacteria bacterium]|nr:valine--tRNA ligase [Deltaproteobacteria bacterium]
MSDDVLDKGYDPHAFEDKWYQSWRDNGYFQADVNKSDNAYCIVIPPPNVTGSLHMGHALNNTLQDILIRYQRMNGVKTLWQCGMDHAGIATQNVVERQIASEGNNRFDLGREEFVERVWKWKEEFGGIIVNQLMKLGASCDWNRERFTMDEGCSRAVREVFVTLYDEGLIYRGNKLINWCPRCHTALSDLEAEHEEIQGNLYYIRYPAAGGSGSLTVATTRPETMLGDTAVAVNPEDERHQGWPGRKVMLPLMDREIPVIGDSYVDLEFGTGALKITPAHDPNDFEIGRKYELDLIKVIGDDGCMTEECGQYAGMDRFEARKKIVADLEAQGLLEKIEPHKHAVGHCYRCKSIVEPNLSLQWFVNVGPMAEEAIKAVEDGRTRIIPANWTKTYFEWMRNIRDWCISRQIWWGHRIPAWYCAECDKITVAKQDPDACGHCGCKDIEQESDVLDTWFSSALWPFSTLGWPDKTPELESFYPTSCLVTGFDILFFWVARMMMMGLKFMGDVPFKDVYIHALVRDEHGHKMSKSKGNVIDPLEIIEKYGTDSFRFTLTSMAAQGRDVSLSEARIEGYRHFVNKIWNASRFALMNLEDYKEGFPQKEQMDIKDLWIMSRLNSVIIQTRRSLEEYRFNDMAHCLYQFMWHEFCDWYLEMAKPQLYQNDQPGRRCATQQIVLKVLRSVLELLHPVMPFVTEEIWQKLPGTDGSIVVAQYPEAQSDMIDSQAEKDMETVINVVTGIRNIRGEMNIAPSARPKADLLYHDQRSGETLLAQQQMICTLAGLAELGIHSEFARPEAAATGVVDQVEIFLSLEGLIDYGEERKRIEKEIAKVLKDLEGVTKKLSNEKFLSKAPEEIVVKQRDKQTALQEKEAKLRGNLDRIKNL